MMKNVDILRPERVLIFTPSGESDRELYVMVDDHLEIAGIEDTQAYIQSFAESTDLSSIIQRVADGEYDLLTKQYGYYIDTTKFPTTVAQLHSQIKDDMLKFDSLDDDIKKELKSYQNFVKMSDDEFMAFIEKHKYVEPISVIDSVVPESEV